jgi:carboxyl-terminal processing protease
MLYKQAPEDRREVRYTAKGRKVLGQGGIAPDFEVSSALKILTLELMNRGAIFGYARKFAARETALSKGYAFPGEPANAGKIPVSRDFSAGTPILEEFKGYLRSAKISFDETKFKEAEPEIRRELEREIVSSLWGMDEGVRAYRKTDAVVLKALEIMPEASKFVADSAPR